MDAIEFPEDNSMDIYSKQGTKVRYLANGGFDTDIERASKYLVIGKIYTVRSVFVGGWFSYVTLEEFPNMDFNTTLFDKVSE